MCGICGVLNFDGSPVNKDQLLEMNKAMVLRGPDDTGHFLDKNYGMAMRRLSIIDLAGGHQPIANEDNTIHVILNGEIYNYVELRQDLENQGHRFSTNTDTEVLVHLYEEYNTGAAKYLNGMFAFAFVDLINARLFLCRDRIGIKPLYWGIQKNCLYFSSQPKSLLKHPDWILSIR